MAINKPDFLAGYSLFYESARYGGDFMAAIENNRNFTLSHNWGWIETKKGSRTTSFFRVPSGIRTHDIQNHNLTL